MSRPRGRVAYVRDGAGRARLLDAVRAWDAEAQVVSRDDMLASNPAQAPGTLVFELSDLEGSYFADLTGRMPTSTRLIGVGELRSLAADAEATALDCLLTPSADDATVRTVLDGALPVNITALLDELLTLTVFGSDLADALKELATRVARAFDADDCILFMTHEPSAYSARQLSDGVLDGLAPLCESVCEVGTTFVAPRRGDIPYRTFLGVPLVHDNAPPLALLVLCRSSSVPFHRDVLRYLTRLASRLATDLSWRLVQERLDSDREQVRDVPRIDPVLGVANHAALQEELSQLVATSERIGEPFSVGIIDVDGLRLINERSGYPAGDAVLAHIAQVAKKKTRPNDMVARYAGDSVAVVMPGLGAQDAAATLTQILSEIDATPVVHENKPINLTVSAGIAELEYDEETGETALARALAARRSARVHGEVIAIASHAVIADAPVQADFAIGTTLGGVYQIRHEISRGAFGVVYRAEDMALARQVALKLLRPDLAADTGFVERFRSEAATLAKIRNPHLVQVYAFGVDGPNVYFAMELVEGQALDERIESARRRKRHFPLTEVTSTIDQVAQALEAVHHSGMLHRDVKPENVLIDRIHRRCVLVDVGIAVRRGGDKDPAGTPGFTAPEVFGSAGESPATDVYSLAALAYLLLTLQPPFRGMSSLETLSLQMARPQPLSSIRRDLPPSIDAVVLPALDPDPTQRPQSAREFNKALAEAVSAATNASGRSKPRMTVELPDVRRPTPVSLRAHSLRPSPGSDPVFKRSSSKNASPSEPSTRGILFRSVYEVLGARRGSAWMAELKRTVPELANALGPQSSALAWHPTSAFIEVLQSLSKDEAQCRTAALQLGRAAAISSFAQFYGADTSSVTPAQALRGADMFWHCYHNWGTASVTSGLNDAEVTITDGIANAILCSSTSGLLAGIVGHAGGRGINVEHRTCVAEKAKACTFQLTWFLPSR